MSEAANIQIKIDTREAEEADRIMLDLMKTSDRLYQSLSDLDRTSPFNRMQSDLKRADRALGSTKAANDNVYLSLVKTKKGYDSAAKGADKYAVSSKKAEKANDVLSGSFGKLAGAIGGISLVAAVKGAISMGNAFDSSMNTVQSKLLITTEAMKPLRDQAKELGAVTSFSASQAADGMGYLAQAGLNATQIMGAMPSTLALASAAGMDLAKSADIATNVMGAFKLKVSDLPAITDVLALTSAKANTSVQEMAEAIKQAGPIAKGFGVNIHETSAAIGQLANNGFKGEQAGMILKNMLANLANPVGEGKKALKELGITQADVFDKAADGSLKFKGMADMLGLLENKSVSTTDMIRIFGREAGPGLISLLGSGDAISKLEKDISRSGAAAEMAAIQMQGMPGVLKSAASAWEAVNIAFIEMGGATAVIVVMQGITTALRYLATDGVAFLQPYVTALGDVFNTVSTEWAFFVDDLQYGDGVFAMVRDGFDAVSSVVSGAANLIGPYAGEIATVFGVLAGSQAVWGIVAGGVGLVSAALTALKMAALTNPIVAGVAAVATAAYLIYDNWSGITAWWSGVWSDMKAGATNFADWWEGTTLQQKTLDISNGAIELARSTAESFFGWWDQSTLKQHAPDFVTSGIDTARSSIMGFFNWWNTTTFSEKIADIKTNTVDAAKQKISEFTGWWTGTTIEEKALAVSSVAVEGARTVSRAFFSWWGATELKKHAPQFIVDGVDKARSVIGGFFQWWGNTTLEEKIADIKAGAVQSVRDMAGEFFGWWKSTTLEEKAVQVSTLYLEGAELAANKFMGLWNSSVLSEWITPISTNPVTFAREKATEFIGWWTETPLPEKLADIKAGAIDVTRSAVTGFLDMWNGSQLQQMVASIDTAPFKAAWLEVETLITNNGLYQSAVAIWNDIEADVLQAGEQILAGLNNAWSDIAAGLEVAFADVSGIFDEFKLTFSAIVGWFDGESGAIGRIFSTVWPEIKAMTQAGWDAVTSIFDLAWTGITAVVRTGWDLATGILKTGLKLLRGDFEGAWDEIGATMTTLKDNLVRGVTEIGPKLLQAGKDVIAGLGQGIRSGAKLAVAAMGDVASDIMSAVRGFFQIESPSKRMLEIGGYILEGLTSGITNGAKNAINAAKRVAGDIYDSVKSFFSIKSPSRLMADLGIYIPEGLAVGIEKGSGKVKTAAEKAAQQAEGAFKRIIQGLEKQYLKLTEGDEAARRYELSMQGVTGSNQNAVIAAEAHIAKLEAQNKKQEEAAQAAEKATAKAREQAEAMARMGEQLTQSLLTPQEAYNAKVKEYDDLLQRNNITQEVYARALAEQKENLADATGATQRAKDEQAELNKVIQQGKQLTESLLTPQEQYDAALEKYAALLDQSAISQETYNRAIEKQKKALDDATGATQKAKEKQEAHNKVMTQGKQVFEATRTNTEKLAARTKELDVLLKAAAIDTDTYSRALKEAELSLSKSAQATAAYEDELKGLNEQQKILEAGLYGGEDAARAAELGIKGYTEAQAESIIQTEKHVEELERLKSIGDSIGDALVNGLLSGDWKSAGKQLLNTIKDAVLGPVIDSLKGGISNAVSGFFSGGGQGGGGLFSGLGKMLGIGGGKAGGGMFGGGGMMGGAMMAGGLGMGIGQLLGAGNPMAMGALSGIGMAIGGPIGAAVGGLIGSLFGGKKEKTGSGFEIGYGSDGVEGQSFDSYKKKKSFWRGTKRWDEFRELDDKVAETVGGFFDNLNTTIVGQAEALGVAGADSILDSFEMATARFTGENAEEQLKNWLKASTRKAYHDAFADLDEDIKVAIQGSANTMGQSTEEIAARFEYVTAVATTVVPTLEALSWNLGETNSQAIKAATGLADAAGGLEQLQVKLEKYYAAAYTSTERAELERQAAQTRLDEYNATIGRTGDAAIDTVAELRAYIDAQDKNTKAGQEAKAAAMDMIDAIVTVSGTADDAAAAANESAAAADSATSSIDDQTSATSTLADAANDAAYDIEGLKSGISDLVSELYGSTNTSTTTTSTSDNGLSAARATLTTLQDRYNAEKDRIAELNKIAQEAYRADLARYQSLKKAAEDMRDFVMGWTRSNPLLTPFEQLQEVQNQYDSTLEKARGGDVDAAKELQTLAGELRTAYTDVYASSSTSENAINQITNDLTGLAGTLDVLAGTEPQEPGDIASTLLSQLEQQISTQEQLISSLQGSQNTTDAETDREALAAALAGKVGELGLAMDVSVFDLLRENGIALDELATDFGVDLDTLDNTFASKITSLASLLHTDSLSLISELGADLTELGRSFGVDVTNLNDDMLGSIDRMADTLHVDSVSLAAELGADIDQMSNLIASRLRESTANMPAGIRDYLAPYLNDIENSNDPATLRTAIMAVQGAVNGVPSNIRGQLNGHLNAIVTSNSPATTNNAIAALQGYVNSLPAGIRGQLNAQLGGILSHTGNTKASTDAVRQQVQLVQSYINGLPPNIRAQLNSQLNGIVGNTSGTRTAAQNAANASNSAASASNNTTNAVNSGNSIASTIRSNAAWTVSHLQTIHSTLQSNIAAGHLSGIRQTLWQQNINWGQTRRLNTYDVGSDYIKGDQVAQIHNKEIIFDAPRADNLRDQVLWNMNLIPTIGAYLSKIADVSAANDAAYPRDVSVSASVIDARDKFPSQVNESAFNKKNDEDEKHLEEMRLMRQVMERMERELKQLREDANDNADTQYDQNEQASEQRKTLIGEQEETRSHAERLHRHKVANG